MTIDSETLKIYREQRAPMRYASGFYQSRANHALNHARSITGVSTRWDHAERAGLVRLTTPPDEMGWETIFDCDSYSIEANPDYPGGERALNAERKALERKVESYGAIGIVGEYRTSPDGQWNHADSVWGFVGDTEPREASGYGPDIMTETLNQLTDALRDEQRKRADIRANRCPECHR